MPKHVPHILLLFTCIFICLQTSAVPGKPFAKADSIVRSMPADAAKSTESLAAWILQHVQGETERSKVIYVWLAYNISYDVYEVLTVPPLHAPLNEAQMVLNKRKGVCSGYAALFNALAHGVGIKSFVVTGMVIMPDGSYANVGHAWNVAMIEGAWRLFDPTWAAGSGDGFKYIKRFSAKWFMPKPEDFIKTHLPFDPIWQLLHFPLTGNQFFKPDGPLQDSSNRCMFNDSIAAYEKQTELERILATAKRMRRNAEKGGADKMPETYKMLSNKYFELKLMGGIYNAAENAYNEGVDKLNMYKAFYNKQYHPLKTYPEIQAMLDVPERLFKYTTWLLHKIESTDHKMLADIGKLQTLIVEIQQFVKEQNEFLKLYFATEPKKRERLFLIRK